MGGTWRGADRGCLRRVMSVRVIRYERSIIRRIGRSVILLLEKEGCANGESVRGRVPANCAYTAQHVDAELAQTQGAPSVAGVGMLNSGLLVVNPARETYSLIERVLQTPSRLEFYNFPDQELLSDVFYGRWVSLPYVYNGLKTLRGEKVHGEIWRDEEVKNVHYIFARKPWDEATGEPTDELSRWWWEANGRRQGRERELGIEDGV